MSQVRISGVPGMARVSMGQTVPSVGISRVDVMANTKGRCLLLSQDWYAVSLAFTETPVKGTFYVDQERMIKYRLRASNYYLGLVARLNTGVDGTVLDDSFRVEYLRLSEGVYTDFCDKARELGGFTNIALTKSVRAEFSYVVPTASVAALDSAIMASIQERISHLDINALWMMCFAAVARPIEEYEKAMSQVQEQAKGLGQQAQPQVGYQQPVAQASPQPQVGYQQSMVQQPMVQQPMAQSQGVQQPVVPQSQAGYQQPMVQQQMFAQGVPGMQGVMPMGQMPAGAQSNTFIGSSEDPFAGGVSGQGSEFAAPPVDDDWE